MTRHACTNGRIIDRRASASWVSKAWPLHAMPGYGEHMHSSASNTNCVPRERERERERARWVDE